MKYIFLSCLFLNGAYIFAQTGLQKLNEIMINEFGMLATPENILHARNPQGKSILHIIPEKAACAKDTSEVCDYAKAQEEIPQEDQQKLLLMLAQEGNSVDQHLVKIMQNHPGPKTVDNLGVFFGVAKFYKENKQPRESLDCSWTKHPYRDAGYFVSGMIVAFIGASIIFAGPTNPVVDGKIANVAINSN